MPGTRVLKPKAVEAPGKSLDRSKPLKAAAVSAARQSGAASCSRCPPQRHKREGSSGALLKPCQDRRTRSRSTAPRTSTSKPGTNPEHRRASSCPRQVAAAAAGQKEQRSGRTEAKHASHSHKAFTVIPPNPKKRRDIQRKAEAELAALEELRLSRAMTYVSINPSSVGGCMSLEEVRLKQQQEMMQARKKPNKPVKTQLMEHTPVVKS